MRILRLGNSEDTSAGIPDELRGWRIAEQLLALDIGEPVETIVRPIWPSPELPRLLAKWLDEYQPDMVFLKVTWFWYGYESVPRRIERLLGRAGKPIARAGLSAAGNKRLARNRAFKFGRRVAHRIIGGDTPFNSHYVLELMETCIRQVVAKEDIVLLVKCSGASERDEGALAGYHERFMRRHDEVAGGIERLCDQLHVSHTRSLPAPPGPNEELRKGDGLHLGSGGQERMGVAEGRAMVAAWRVAHPKSESAGTLT